MESIFTGVVKLKSIRTAFVKAALTSLKLISYDVVSAYTQ